MTESDIPRSYTLQELTSCNRGLEMYSKDHRVRRREAMEVKDLLTAREVILKAEKHPAVQVYLNALKFVEEEKRAKAQDGPHRLSGKFADAEVAPEDDHARDRIEDAATAKQQKQPNNIIYLPFM